MRVGTRTKPGGSVEAIRRSEARGGRAFALRLDRARDEAEVEILATGAPAFPPSRRELTHRNRRTHPPQVVFNRTVSVARRKREVQAVTC